MCPLALIRFSVCPPRQGFDQEGVDDLVSGILMGSYHSGGGGGPLIGGAAKHILGFPWSGAAFAVILAAQVNTPLKITSTQTPDALHRLTALQRCVRTAGALELTAVRTYNSKTWKDFTA